VKLSARWFKWIRTHSRSDLCIFRHFPLELQATTSSRSLVSAS